MNKFFVIILIFLTCGYSYSDENEFLKTLKEAELGDPISQNNVAHMYDNGLGTEKNLSKALYWYLKAGEQNQVNALTSIASYYLDGEVVEQNYSVAFKIYKDAANMKYENSAFYKIGKKNKIDYQSLFFINQSRAIYALGLMYEKGYGVKTDFSKAKDLYKKADSYGHELSKTRLEALNGDSDYAYFLAKYFFDGSMIEIGIPIDYEESAFWNKISEFLGGGDPELFNKVLDLISEKEFHDASKRFEVWKANMGFEYDKETLKEVSSHYLNHYGTGFYISENILLSNRHVLFVDRKKEKMCSKLIAYDPYNSKFEKLEYTEFRTLPKIEDVKFVRSIKKSKNFINISKENVLPVEDIYVIGFPAGREKLNYPRVSRGIINSDVGLANNEDQFIFDAFAEGGSSGSPILNRKGELLGILWGGGIDKIQLSSEETKTIQRTNEGYAVKSNYITKLLNYNKINLPKANQKLKNNVNEIIREKMKAVRLIQCYDKYEETSNTSQWNWIEMLKFLLIKKLSSNTKKNKKKLKFFSELGIFLVLSALISSGISIYYEYQLNSKNSKLVKLELEEFKIQEWLSDASGRNLDNKIGKFTHDTIDESNLINISKKRYFFYLLTWYPFTIKYAIQDIDLIENQDLKNKYNFKDIKDTNEKALKYVFDVYENLPLNDNLNLTQSELDELEQSFEDIIFQDIKMHLDISEFNTLQINLFFQEYNKIIDLEKEEIIKDILNITNKSTNAILYAFLFQLFVFSLVQIFELREISWEEERVNYQDLIGY